MKLPFEINARGKLTEKTDNLQGIIAKYLSSAAGRAKLAASMVQPLRRRLDYQGIARQVFPIQQLPPATTVYYPNPIVDEVVAQRVTVPEFEIYESPTIKISQIKQRRFNIINHGRKKLFINPRGKLVHE